MGYNNRIRGIMFPFNLLENKNPDMIKFLKSNGVVTLLKYCEMTVDSHEDARIERLLKAGYIVSVTKSDEVYMSVGVQRKGIGEYNKLMEKLGIAKIYSKKIGYIIILGKMVGKIDRFFLGDEALWDSEKDLIEMIMDGEECDLETVSKTNVSKRNTDNISVSNNNHTNNTNKDNTNTNKIKKIKKIRKLKVKEVEELVPEKKKKKSSLDLLKDLENKNKKPAGDYEKAIKKREESKLNPSQKKVYQAFKKKEIEDWNCEDFLGFYLNHYKELMDIEDMDFVNLSRAKTNTILMSMGKFKKAFFENRNSEMKDYFIFAMDYIMDPDTWVDGDISIRSLVMNKLSVSLVKSFMVSKTGNKKGKKKKIREKDLESSDSKSWTSKIDKY